MMIDAHVHLWEIQNGLVNGNPVFGIGGGRSNFGGELRQMLPPYMIDGRNTVELLLSNMDYAGVSGAVITQEYIDGNQDEYLQKAKQKTPDRLKICSLYQEEEEFSTQGFDGVKVCAARLKNLDLTMLAHVFQRIEMEDKFLSIDLADGDRQTGSLLEMIQAFPKLRIAIGHFGMVGRQNWKQQIRLAQNKNVYIESGGITWLFHKEFYPYHGAVKAVREAAELCGMEKLMWGSDYPRTMTAITYQMSFDFIQKTKQLSDAEKALFLGENASRFYGFEHLPTQQAVLNMLED